MDELILKMAKLIKEREEWVEMMDEISEELEAAQLAHAELVEVVARLRADVGTVATNPGEIRLAAMVYRRLGALLDGK